MASVIMKHSEGLKVQTVTRSGGMGATVYTGVQILLQTTSFAMQMLKMALVNDWDAMTLMQTTTIRWPT